MTANGSNNKWIGKRTPRPDGADKVTGRATFGADFSQPGMLTGKILRSPHPHARIKSIDLEKAVLHPMVAAAASPHLHSFKRCATQRTRLKELVASPRSRSCQNGHADEETLDDDEPHSSVEG